MEAGSIAGAARQLLADTQPGADPAHITGALPSWAAILISAFLVLLSGLFAGLTLGLLSLDLVGLRILSQGGDAKERVYATKLIPLRQKGNLLLCTLLLGNTAVNSAISILLSEVTSGVVGLIVSTSIILVLGEILPQAVCSRHSLSIGSRLVLIVQFFMVLFWPITRPLSFFLDKMLGRDIGTVYSQDELKRLIEIHVEDPDAQKESGLTTTDQRLLTGIFDYKNKKVKDVMTPADQAFMLERSVRLNFQTLSKIYISGCSRIPVYDGERSNVVGIMFVKDLILVDPDDEMEVATVMAFRGRNVSRVYEDVTLDKVLDKFMQNSNHMLIAHAPPSPDVDTHGPIGHTAITGLITLEDVLEEMIRAEIYDESDEAEETAGRRRRDTHRRDVSIYLRLFEHKLRGSRLSQPEVQAVYAFLAVNLEEFRPLAASELAFKGLIRTAQVLERGAPDAVATAAALLSGDGSSTPSLLPGIEEPMGSRFWDSLTRDGQGGPGGSGAATVNGGSPGGLGGIGAGLSLYERGVASPFFTLILQGKVLIRTGDEGFELDLGAWSHVGNKALVLDSYVPNFDAAAIPPYRLLRIHRVSYLAALDASRLEQVRGYQSIKSQMRLAATDLQTQGNGSLAAISFNHLLMHPEDSPTDVSSAQTTEFKASRYAQAAAAGGGGGGFSAGAGGGFNGLLRVPFGGDSWSMAPGTTMSGRAGSGILRNNSTSGEHVGGASAMHAAQQQRGSPELPMAGSNAQLAAVCEMHEGGDGAASRVSAFGVDAMGPAATGYGRSNSNSSRRSPQPQTSWRAHHASDHLRYENGEGMDLEMVSLLHGTGKTGLGGGIGNDEEAVHEATADGGAHSVKPMDGEVQDHEAHRVRSGLAQLASSAFGALAASAATAAAAVGLPARTEHRRRITDIGVPYDEEAPEQPLLQPRANASDAAGNRVLDGSVSDQRHTATTQNAAISSRASESQVDGGEPDMPLSHVQQVTSRQTSHVRRNAAADAEIRHAADGRALSGSGAATAGHAGWKAGGAAHDGELRVDRSFAAMHGREGGSSTTNMAGIHLQGNRSHTPDLVSEQTPQVQAAQQQFQQHGQQQQAMQPQPGQQQHMQQPQQHLYSPQPRAQHSLLPANLVSQLAMQPSSQPSTHMSAGSMQWPMLTNHPSTSNPLSPSQQPMLGHQSLSQYSMRHTPPSNSVPALHHIVTPLLPPASQPAPPARQASNPWDLVQFVDRTAAYHRQLSLQQQLTQMEQLVRLQQQQLQQVLQSYSPQGNLDAHASQPIVPQQLNEPLPGPYAGLSCFPTAAAPSAAAAHVAMEPPPLLQHGVHVAGQADLAARAHTLQSAAKAGSSQSPVSAAEMAQSVQQLQALILASFAGGVQSQVSEHQVPVHASQASRDHVWVVGQQPWTAPQSAAQPQQAQSSQEAQLLKEHSQHPHTAQAVPPQEQPWMHGVLAQQQVALDAAAEAAAARVPAAAPTDRAVDDSRQEVAEGVKEPIEGSNSAGHSSTVGVEEFLVVPQDEMTMAVVSVVGRSSLGNHVSPLPLSAFTDESADTRVDNVQQLSLAQSQLKEKTGMQSVNNALISSEERGENAAARSVSVAAAAGEVSVRRLSGNVVQNTAVQLPSAAMSLSAARRHTADSSPSKKLWDDLSELSKDL